MANSINFSNLKIDIVESTTEVVYRFVGDVDENFRQEDVPRIRKDRIVFELAGVDNFNSCGIREWIFLVREIGKLGTLIFRECSVTMIDQINMVPDSLGRGKIESFYAPYYCECGGEVNRLVKVEEAMSYLVTKRAPEFDCAKCGQPLEFDALEESYFLFTDTVLPKAG